MIPNLERLYVEVTIQKTINFFWWDTNNQETSKSEESGEYWDSTMDTENGH